MLYPAGLRMDLPVDVAADQVRHAVRPGAVRLVEVVP